MRNHEVVTHLRAAFRRQHTPEKPNISFVELDAQLANAEKDFEKEPNPIDAVLIEQMKDARERDLAIQKMNADADLEMFKAVIAAGVGALRTVLAINGLAATAVLAFLGQALGRQLAMPFPGTPLPKGFVSQFAPPLTNFVIGVLVAASGTGALYCCQYFYSNRRPVRLGHLFNLLAIALAVSGLALFAVGTEQLYTIFKRF